jgi:soluble lytic murein transglycosylase-like protein
MRFAVLLFASAISVSPVNPLVLQAVSDYSAGPELTAPAVATTSAPQVAPPPAPAPPVPVPAEFEPWIQRAGHKCAGITPGLIAAQVYTESTFVVTATSYSNAQGPGQFIPETWARWGVDADADGSTDPYSIADSVMALADFMCFNIDSVRADIAAGKVTGDPVDLALAAYNAGLGAVQHAGGMPEGGDYSTQTQPYVAKIRGLETSFDAALENRV